MFRDRGIERRLMRQVVPDRAGPYIALAVSCGLAAGIVAVWQAYLLSHTVASVFLDGSTLAGVRPWLQAFLLAALLRAAAIWGGEVAAQSAAARVKTALRTRLLSHLQTLGPAALRDERSGELSHTLVDGIEALDAYISQYLPQLALAALVPLGILCFVFPLDAISGLVFLLTAPLIPLFMVLIGSLAEALTGRQWVLLSRMSAHFLDMLQGLATLKIFGRSREQIQAIAEVSDGFRATTMNVLRVTFLSALVLELVSTLSTAVVAVEIGLRLLYGRLAFEQAFFVLILAPEFYLPLRTLGLRFHAGMAGVAAARRIFQLLDAGAGPLQKRHATLSPTAQPPALSFQAVTYAYAGGDRPALHGVSFDVNAGETVALVGPSGGGKSTVAELLLRFVEPSDGQITVCGRPLSDFDPDTWREKVVWVPQLPYLFHGTIAENIRLGRPEASHDEVVRAAEAAGAGAFIRALPHGYDTLIGERGARLSGGQIQRLALARAFLRNAPLVILDEATANLDPAHEARVEDSVRRLLQGRTTLLITHRLSAAARADRVVVLVAGRVVEQGSHGELLERGGIYRRLWEASGMTPGSPSFTGRPATQAVDDVDAPAFLPPVERGEPESKGTAGPAAPGGWRLTVRLLAFLAPFWPWVGLSVLLGFLAVASGIGLLATSAWIIATAALQPSIAVLQVAIVGVRFFGIARGGFRYLERLASHEVTFRLLARLRVWFYAALEPIAPARLMRYRSGDLLARVVADIDSLEHFYVRVVGPPAVAALVAVTMGLFMAAFDGRLALVLLAFLAAVGVLLPVAMSALSRRPGQALVATRARLQAAAVDGIQGMADLVAFGAARLHVATIGQLGSDLAALQQRMAFLAGLQAALASLGTNLAVLCVLILAVPLVVAGRLPGVDLAVLALAAVASFEAVSPLPLAAQYLESSLAAARRLFEIPQADAPAAPAALGPAALAPASQGSAAPSDPPETVAHPPVLSFSPTPLALRFSNLSFRYLPDERLALDGVSFAVPAGSRLAVVGPSGAGKTSLVNLLLRFWDYEKGEIWLGSRELRSYTGDKARSLLAVVTQRTHLFNATVRENLLLARPSATEAELEWAAQQAQIHDFIVGLPQGYDTWLGEQGLQLSGGERQRLAIARALLKHAPVLLLDEPTANLDALTEAAVRAVLTQVSAGKTTVMITHRLSGLEDFDQILVLRRGRVVECGSYRQLMAARGLFRCMWEVQQQFLAGEELQEAVDLGQQLA